MWLPLYRYYEQWAIKWSETEPPEFGFELSPCPLSPKHSHVPTRCLFSALLSLYSLLETWREKVIRWLLFLGWRYFLYSKQMCIYSFNMCVPACLHVRPMHAGCRGQGRTLDPLGWSQRWWCEPPGKWALGKNSHASSSLDAQALTGALSFTSVVHGVLFQGYLFLYLKVTAKE